MTTICLFVGTSANFVEDVAGPFGGRIGRMRLADFGSAVECAADAQPDVHQRRRRRWPDRRRLNFHQLDDHDDHVVDDATAQRQRASPLRYSILNSIRFN